MTSSFGNASPFDDPEVKAQMARMGMVHKPGVARETLHQLAPLLAAEDIDVDDLGNTDLETLNAALARATERHNLELFTPVGAQRAAALDVLRRVTDRIAVGDDTGAADILDAVEPEPAGGKPAVSHVTGVALGLLDEWHGDRAVRGALSDVRMPRTDRRSRAAGTDILVLAAKGRAFGSLDSLHLRHGGKAILDGGALAVAACAAAWGARNGADPAELLGRATGSAATPAPVSPTTDAASGTHAPVTRLTPSARASTTHRAPASAATSSLSWRDAGDAFPGARGHATPRRGKRRGRSGNPAHRDVPPQDRALLREFEAWLREQPEIAAPTVDDEVNMLRVLLQVGRLVDVDVHDAVDVAPFIDYLYDIEDEDDPQSAGATDDALSTLHDYVHFRLDTAADPHAWDDAHAAIADDDQAGPVGGIAAAIHESDLIPEDGRRAALAGTRVVAAVSGLLDWIGERRQATSTGALRRADIQAVAGMLGVSAVGVAKRPASADVLPLTAGPDVPLAEPGTVYALSMTDVPVLAAWWGALGTADLIDARAGRVRPGDAAAEWRVDAVPPLEPAEHLAAAWIAEIITIDLDAGTFAAFDRMLVVDVIDRIMRALDVGFDDADGDADAGPERSPVSTLLAPRALRTLQRMADAGFLDGDVTDAPIVPAALRGTTARGVLLALVYLAHAFPEDGEGDD